MGLAASRAPGSEHLLKPVEDDLAVELRRRFTPSGAAQRARTAAPAPPIRPVSAARRQRAVARSVEAFVMSADVGGVRRALHRPDRRLLRSADRRIGGAEPLSGHRRARPPLRRGPDLAG
ncbi:hypothetical protein GCM10010250_40430 [Streptomyces althioticus]|nr:hypothetical protein GCM10010250_40430 [Streptomyces althioticus]GGT55160.1 hypothetical protein GCM10010243_36990 [Streptomyces matensis]